MTRATYRSTARFSRNSRGFTLIEMMIAITLGLIVTAAIGYIFVSSKRNFTYSQGMARMQENSRAGIIIMDTLIRQAGYIFDAPGGDLANDPSKVFVGNYAAIYGGIPTSGLSGTAMGSNVANVSFDPLVNTDFIQVSFFGDYTPGTSPATGGTISDCLGRAVYQNEIAVNIFYVAKGANDQTTSLYCWSISYKSDGTAGTNGAQPAPLIYGVTGLVASYGIDCDGDQSVNYYTSATIITTVAPGVADPGCGVAPDWRQVKSVKLTLYTQSTESVGATGIDAASTTSYSSINNTGAVGHSMVVSGRQAFLERPLTQTIFIRNRLITTSSS